MLNFPFSSAVLERITEVERPEVSETGDHLIVVFNNDFGLSILRDEYTYGGSDGLFEAVVIRGNKHLSDGDPFGDGEIIGWLTEDDVLDLAERVSAHTPEVQRQYEELRESEEIVLLFESIRLAILRTDVAEDPRDPDNPAKFREGVDISPEARQAVKSTTELFIKKVKELNYTVPTFLTEVLENL